MMRVEISRRSGVFGLALAAGALCGGCGGKGAGETVPSPPRELVEKSFRRPRQWRPAYAGGAAARRFLTCIPRQIAGQVVVSLTGFYSQQNRFSRPRGRLARSASKTGTFCVPGTMNTNAGKQRESVLL